MDESTKVADEFGVGDFFENYYGPSTAEAPQDSSENVQTTAQVEDGAPNVGEDAPTETVSAERPCPDAIDELLSPEPTSAPETDDVTSLRSQLAEAMALIGTLAQRQQEAPGEVKLEVPPTGAEKSRLDFLRGREITDILSSPESFNEALNEIATVAARAGAQMGYEQAMRSLPSVTQATIMQQLEYKQAVDDYFSKHSDLLPFRKAVGVAAQEYYSKNPKAQLPDILKEAGERTREVLRIRGTTTGRKPAQPAVAPGAVNRTDSAQKKDTVAQQIEAMLRLP